jgi:hypothetical protein
VAGRLHLSRRTSTARLLVRNCCAFFPNWTRRPFAVYKAVVCPRLPVNLTFRPFSRTLARWQTRLVICSA